MFSRSATTCAAYSFQSSRDSSGHSTVFAMTFDHIFSIRARGPKRASSRRKPPKHFNDCGGGPGRRIDGPRPEFRRQTNLKFRCRILGTEMGHFWLLFSTLAIFDHLFVPLLGRVAEPALSFRFPLWTEPITLVSVALECIVSRRFRSFNAVMLGNLELRINELGSRRVRGADLTHCISNLHHHVTGC